MNEVEKAAISTILYYHLLGRPLSAVELFKFLAARDRQPSLRFSDFVQILDNSRCFFSLICRFRGFYFLKNCDQNLLFSLRQKRIKISQVKWKRLRRAVKFLQITPFARMIGVTGSLSLDNAQEQSDLDVLIVLAKNRLWLGRLLVTLTLAALGLRRHGRKTKDRICLNCYLTSDNLNITPQIKPHDLHSAQEYSRLVSVWQAKQRVPDFKISNSWIGLFLANFPWPDHFNLKAVPEIKIFTIFRQIFEFLLSGYLGDWIERQLGLWQIKRIERKTKHESPADQIYFSNQCLMFHPQSKGLDILNRHDAKLREMIAVN